MKICNLDEVHFLLFEKHLRFLFSGSSARKLKKEGADSLGSRAGKRTLYPLVWPEVPDLDIDRAEEPLSESLLKEYNSKKSKTFEALSDAVVDVLDCTGEPAVFSALESAFGKAHLYVRDDPYALKHIPVVILDNPGAQVTVVVGSALSESAGIVLLEIIGDYSVPSESPLAYETSIRHCLDQHSGDFGHTN